MSGPGAVPSIIGVAGAGFRLSLILNAVSCEAANEGLEVHSISKTVTLFSLTLKQTGTTLQTIDSVHSREALEDVHAIAEKATWVFDQFNDMLDRVGSRPTDGSPAPPLQQRFQWCFKRHRVTYLLAQLDSLKLSLSIILQVLQLGKLMASTSRNDPPDEVAAKTEAIRSERAETQNVLIVRYWQMSKLERLFEASRLEDEADRIPIVDDQEPDLTLVNSGSSQLAIEAPPAPPEYTSSMALIKMPDYSLGELDVTLHRIKTSPRDMVQVSDQAIDQLLDRWTRWHDMRERRHVREASGRYGPSVQNLYEEDEDRPYYEQYRERDGNARGVYLEGPTTDWRQPHSVAARQEAKQRKQQYSKYQPSVSAASSDVEDSPGSNHSKNSKKRVPRHHIIDSSSESSDSEPDQPRLNRRRGSQSPTVERRVMFADGAPLTHSYTTGQMQSRNVSSPANAVPSGGTRLRPSPHLNAPVPPPRPQPTPEQNFHHPSYSSPLPPINTSNAPNPYSGQQGGYYPPPHVPYQPAQYSSSASARYTPPVGPGVHRGMSLPPRPVSQDGKGPRSPSRPSYPNNVGRSYVKTEEERKQSRDKTKKNLREGATKGLLGAGAIAGFLEALEGLSI